MFKKIAKKIILALAALNLIILSACSSVSNLTPQKVAQSDSGKYTLTMSARINDKNVIRGSEKPYIIIGGEKILMKPVLNFRNEIMYQYDYNFPKDKSSVQYYYLIEYKVTSDNGKYIFNRSLQGEEVFVLKPLTKVVSEVQLESAAVGTIVPIQGYGFDESDVVLVGNKEAETTCLSANTLEFVVPALEAKKRYDVEIKHKDTPMTWAGALYIKQGDLSISPTSIEKESGQVINMIFDIGFKAPRGGYYIDVQTNIPSSVIMSEVIVEEGETSVAIPVKFAAAGRGALFVNAVGFKEVVIPTAVEAIVAVEVDLVNAQEDEISENTLVPVVQEEPTVEPVLEPAVEETVEETIIIEPKE